MTTLILFVSGLVMFIVALFICVWFIWDQEL